MHCYFCQRNKKDIDYKNTKTLEKFTSAAGKIKSRKKTGLCALHQRRVSRSIKRARYMALMPFVKE